MSVPPPAAMSSSASSSSSSDVIVLDRLVAGLNTDNARLSSDVKRLEQTIKEQESQLIKERQRISRLEQELLTQEQQHRSREKQLMEQIQQQQQSQRRELPLYSSVNDKQESVEYVKQLQQLLNEKETQIDLMNEKLIWYAENQALIDDIKSKAEQDKQTIKQLTEQINRGKQQHRGKATETQRHPHSESIRPTRSDNKEKQQQSLPSDLRRIRVLEQEIVRLKQRNEDPLVSLIAAARPSIEESGQMTELQKQIKQLNEQLESKDEEWEDRMRSIRQEQQQIRVGYEKRVASLQSALQQTKLAQLKSKKGLSTSSSLSSVNLVQSRVNELEHRLGRQKEFYRRKMNNLREALEHGVKVQHLDDDNDDLHQLAEQARLTPTQPEQESERESTASGPVPVSPVKRPRSAGTPAYHQYLGVHEQTKSSFRRERQPATPAIRARSLSPQPSKITQTPNRKTPTRLPSPPTPKKTQAEGVDTGAAPPPPASSASSAAHPSSSGLDMSSLQVQLDSIKSALESSHATELRSLSTHYQQLLTDTKQQAEQSINTLRQHLSQTESQLSALNSRLFTLQQENHSQQQTIAEQQRVLQRLQEKPGYREYHVLAQTIEALEQRLHKREREYAEENQARADREEAARVRLIEKYERSLRKKAQQLRDMEVEMERLIDQIQLFQTQQEQQQQRQHTQRQGLEEKKETAATSSSRGSASSPSPVTEGAVSAAFPNYVALLEKLERGAEESILRSSFSSSQRGRGKENNSHSWKTQMQTSAAGLSNPPSTKSKAAPAATKASSSNKAPGRTITRR